MFQVAGSDSFQTRVISRTSSAIGRALRLVAALVLAIPVVATVAGVSSVSATLTLVPQTAFEIDGNLPVNGNGGVPNVSIAGDWGTSVGTPASSWTGGTYDPGLTPGGLPSTGSYYMYRDMDACDSSTDTIGVGGDKVDFGPLWPVAIGNVLNKGDVKSVSLAAEKVNVNGTINDIVYAAFELCQDAGGSFNAVLYFDDGDGVPPSADDNGDYIIIFDFKSAQVGEGSLFQRVGGNWVFQNKDATKIDTFATGLVGEAAINLTTLGILPAAPGAGAGGTPPACRTIQVGGQAGTISGYSTGSQLKDIVGVTPLDLSNCGPLKVTKLSNATDPTTEFGYDVVRANSGAVHDTTLGVSGGAVTTEPDADIVEIDATINVGETHTWTKVISQPNYKITEDVPPVGWALISISCTYPNIFAAPVGGVYPTATSVIYTANAYTAAQFLVPPSIIDLGGALPVTLPAAECSITNNVTGIKIVKTGTGDPSTLFPFADNSGTPKIANLTIVDNPATPAVVENATTFLYAAGVNVTITETIPATNPGWTLVGVSCVRPNGIVVATSATASVAVMTVAGEVITCTYTNNQKGRITVAKTGTGDTSQLFPFEQSWDGNTDAPADSNLTIGGAATNSGDLAPGVYTVQELLPVTTPAWVLASVVCTDTAAGSNGSSTVVAGPLATVTLAAGDTVNCVYNNTQKGRLVINKTAVGGNDTFAFSGPVSSVTTTGTAAGGTGSLGVDVVPGVFNVVETAPAGWDLTGSFCDNGETLPNVNVGSGETVTCSFTNTKRGTITVEKQTTPNGSAQLFGFEASWNGVANGTADFSLADNGTQPSGLIVPGTYSVAELGLTGWDLTSATCTDGSPVAAISLQAGEDITCTFNNRQRGTITVEKQTTPASAQLFGFEASWNGVANGTADFSLADNGTQSSGLIQPGTYSVAELALTGWDLTSSSCTDGSPVGAISLQPGENITCTFNNTQRGNIRIIKQSGVSAGTFNYTGTWTGAATFAITTTGTSPNFTGEAYYANVLPGSYTVTEVAPFGDFDLKSLQCVESSGDGLSSPATPINQAAGTIDLDPGETVTCTYNNTKRGVIVIEKDAVPNLPDDFSFTGDAPVGNFNLDDDGSELNTLASSKTVTGVTSTSVAGATYTVTEGVTDGWNLTGLTCSNASVVSTITRTAEIAVGPGETVTCRFTNTAITPTLIINKTAVGGDRAFNFDVTNLAGSPLVVTTTGGSGSSALTGLVPGVSYTVSEQLLSEWIEGTLTCEIDPAGVASWSPIATTFIAQPGAAYRCAITNTKLGRIIIDKVTIPAASPVSFDFNASWDTGTDPDFSLTDAAAPADSGFTLTPNASYTVTEVGQTGWALTAATCSDGSTVVLGTGVATIDLAPGEVVTCTYTNSQRGAVTVLKTASAATPVAGQPTQWDVTYTVTVTSASQIAELYDLADTFHFGTGITVVSTTATGPSGTIVGFTGGASAPGNTLADDVSIPALGQHLYTINVRVTVAGSSADRDCDPGDPATGTLNTATVTSQGASASSSDCALIPDPAITVVKSVVSEPVRNANGTLTIVYGIAVTNAAGAGNGTYNLVDTFGFGTGITVVSKAVTASPAGVTINPAYATTPADNTIATGVIIGPGLLLHNYQVTVTVSVVATPDTDGDCSAGDPSTGLLNTVTVTVDGHPGDDDSICRPVSTLRLVKTVTNDNGGNLTPADVTLTAVQGATTVLNGTASVGGAVLPGAYDLAESPFPVPGYTASTWSCVSGSVAGATVTVGSAANVVCTINNNDIAPTVTLTKIVQNDHGGTAAAGDFSLQIDGTTRTQNVAIPVTANALHTVSELPKAGYQQVSLVCVNAAGTTLANPFTPTEGDVVTCTITNVDLTPRIRLVKVVENDNGGLLTAGSFSLTLDNVVKTQNVFVDVDANLELTVSELAVAGYVPTQVVCTSNLGRNTTLPNAATISLTPALDEDITCTITNTDVPPGLTVIKEVNNDNGGNAVVANFPLQVNGNTVTSGVPATYPANLALAITETQLAGYTATSTVCTSTVVGSANAKTVNTAGGTTVTLAPGEAVICTITNDDIAPTITVIKSLTNNDGGNAVVADFVLNLGAATVTSGTINTVTANTSYLVSEAQIPGYTQTSLVCVNGTTPVANPVVANEGDNIVCTITNNDVAPRITVNKVVVNNNGGKALVSDFNLYLNHLLVVAPVTSGTANTVLANTSYTVSEDQIAGYAQSGLVVCVNGVTPVAYPVVANEGDNIVCTITNDDIAPTITVIKAVVNDDGGTALVGDFDLYLGTLGVDAPVTSGTANTVSANSAYTVSEGPFAGYAPTGVVCVSNDPERDDSAAGTGTITITPGLAENIVCTITNSDVRPGLTVVKNVINDNGGNAVVSDFVLKVGTTAVASGATNTYPANTDLVISEVQVPGYTATSTVCVSTLAGSNNISNALAGATVRLLPGETVVCTITNDDKPIDLEIIKGDGGANPILGGAFNYTLTITNLGTRVPDGGEPIVVTDLLPAGLLFSTPLPAGCVAAGQTLTCTLAAANLGPAMSVVLTIPVTVSLTATAGTVTNKAFVTTDDDPVCVGECTPPPPCPVVGTRIELVSNSSNNVDCEDTPIQEVADLAIVKTVSDATPTVGQSFDWILTVTNLGPNVAKDVAISDLVPASVVVTGVASSDFECIRVGNGVSCTRATLAVGASGTIRITVLLPLTTPVETTIVNVAEVTGSVFDPDLTNNTSRATAIPEPPVVLPPPPTNPPIIPETGSDVASGLLLGLAMVLFGGFISIIARRRSRHSDTNA